MGSGLPVPGLPGATFSQDGLCTNPQGERLSSDIRLIRHRAGALRLWLPPGHLDQLQHLLDAHSFWARHRSRTQLLRMLLASQAVVSAWQGRHLVGFGRASSDRVFRAVLWDVVVSGPQQGQGLGRRLVGALLQCPAVRQVERVYLMTTNSAGFYRRLGFEASHRQQLLVWHPSRLEGDGRAAGAVVASHPGPDPAADQTGQAGAGADATGGRQDHEHDHDRDHGSAMGQ